MFGRKSRRPSRSRRAPVGRRTALPIGRRPVQGRTPSRTPSKPTRPPMRKPTNVARKAPGSTSRSFGPNTPLGVISKSTGIPVSQLRAMRNRSKVARAAKKNSSAPKQTAASLVNRTNALKAASKKTPTRKLTQQARRINNSNAQKAANKALGSRATPSRNLRGAARAAAAANRRMQRMARMSRKKRV